MTEQINGSAIKEVERLALAAACATVTIDGRQYATTPLVDPRKPEPVPETIGLSTLSSLVEFIRCKQDGDYIAARKKFIHVASPTVVRLCTGIFGEFNQRAEIARVTSPLRPFAFGQWMTQDAFMVAMQTMFVATPQCEALRKMVSSVRDEAIRASDDDGVSQVVTAKKGVAMVREVTIPNPHNLRPFRTFADIEQPESPFILRLRTGPSGAPEFALFECDGGAWQLLATQSIVFFLRDAVRDAAQVYG